MDPTTGSAPGRGPSSRPRPQESSILVKLVSTACPRRWTKALPALILAAALPGCSATASRTSSSGSDLDLVAQNLVFTLVQLPETNPLSTTVQISEPVTPFGREVARLVEEAGYGIQSVPDDRGGDYLRYRVQQTDSELGSETRYAVSIGAVSVERAYGTVDGRLLPAARQRVEGARSRTVELNDDVFGPVDDASKVADVVFDDDAAPTLVDETSGNSSADLATASAVSSFAASVKQNRYDRVSSNYAVLFAAYADVSTTTVSFPNDSLRLGDEQKRILDEYAGLLRPETDILSIVGCSNGKTTIPNGNGILAVGRANRVKEALMFAGVPAETVYDEGCWSGSGHESFPARGVVVTLKRRLG